MDQFYANVKGRVQGVCFRYETQRQARALGLMGYVKNLADGSVEVLAQGSAADLTQLESWLHQGPSAASVHEVAVKRGQVKHLWQDFLIED